MAARRMFAKTVVESARFLKMPVSSQNLYFHLGLNADDDGIVEAYSVINLVKANEDDLRVLSGKGFVKVLNEDLVTYITNWREQNTIRADRKKDSIYKELLLQIDPDVNYLESRVRGDLAKKNDLTVHGQSDDYGETVSSHPNDRKLSVHGQANDNEMSAGGLTGDRRLSEQSLTTDGEMTAQYSVGKDSVGKDRIGKCSTMPDTHTVKYQLKKEYITEAEYEELISKYSKTAVDSVISRILEKPYYGCLNVPRIASWCAERANKESDDATGQNRSKHAEQLAKLSQERSFVQYG